MLKPSDQSLKDSQTYNREAHFPEPTLCYSANTERIDSLGRSYCDYLPLTLTLGDRSVDVTALLDTGASLTYSPA
ncbi:hypothetical protein ACOKW7_06055 [Limnospira platensis CENA597]|uniref:hypothetical protein n=1 Tax=Limnospira platensis TaxID=118562 RepID=UPI003DA1244B